MNRFSFHPVSLDINILIFDVINVFVDGIAKYM